MTELTLIGRHLALTLSLFRRYGAVLTAVTAAGMLLHHVLLRVAVELGMANRLAGLVGLSPVILLNLLMMVGSLMILRQGLPDLPLRRSAASSPAAADDSVPSRALDSLPFAAALLAVLLPFYGYYAGWGMLSDTLRSYAQAFSEEQIRRIDFSTGSSPAAFDVGNAAWVVVAVAAIWVIRYGAKWMQMRSAWGFWPLVIVCCEATWALLGLYVVGGWKDQFVGWLATLPNPADLLRAIIPAAVAQTVADSTTRPVDWPPEFALGPFLTRLFWYAMLPLIWFNLAAIVYGHNLSRQENARIQSATASAEQRWNALPKPLTDFIGYFWAGVVKRWYAVTNGVVLASSAGVAVTLSVIVLWRFVDWAGNWAWIGIANLIGPHDAIVWQMLSEPLNALFNAPGAPSGGLLVAPLQFCVLAAGLDMVGQVSAARSAEVTSAAEPLPPKAG